MRRNCPWNVTQSIRFANKIWRQCKVQGKIEYFVEYCVFGCPEQFNSPFETQLKTWIYDNLLNLTIKKWHKTAFAILAIFMKSEGKQNTHSNLTRHSPKNEMCKRFLSKKFSFLGLLRFSILIGKFGTFWQNLNFFWTLTKFSWIWAKFLDL